MSGHVAVLAVTLVGLLFFVTLAWVVSSVRAYRAMPTTDAAARKRRGRLFTPCFSCCSVLAAVFGLVTLFFVQQLRSDVSLFAYDPWTELGLQGETWDAAVIKRAYRQLSLKYHPDRKPDGDAKRFQRIARAYNTLTDDKAKRNFLEYGNPEGKLFNVGEMPDWLSTGGGNSADAGKRKAAILMLGLVAVLLCVPVVGLVLVRNRSYINNLETGGETDPVEGFARMPAARRREFARHLKAGFDAGEVPEEEYKDWVEILEMAEKRAAELGEAAVLAGTAGDQKQKGQGQGGQKGQQQSSSGLKQRPAGGKGQPSPAKGQAQGQGTPSKGASGGGGAAAAGGQAQAQAEEETKSS